MSGEIAKIPNPDSDPNSQIIDAEFEVKEEGSLKEAEPVQISPEEQAKLDETLQRAEEQQRKEGESEFQELKEALGKKFEREANGKVASRTEGVREKAQVPGSKNSKDVLTEREKVWVEELQSKIKEQKALIVTERSALKREQEEYKLMENEKQPWYSVFTDPIGTYHADKLKDKRGEIGMRKLHLEQLRIYLEELEGDLEKTIKGL